MNRILTNKLSGQLDFLRIHRPTPEQSAANLLLPADQQILGPVVYEVRDIGNLILNAAMENNGAPQYFTSLPTFYTFTDTTPNYDDMAGTYAQSGTTLTRSTGAGVFAAGDVGKEVKFGTGERCHIVTYTNSTTVTVSKSQTVAATTLRRYFTTATTSGSTQSKASTSPGKVLDYTTGIGYNTFSTVFGAAPSAYTLGSIQLTNLARIVLPVPVAVARFDQLSMSYTIQLTATGRATHNIVLSQAIAGYPVAYPVATISGNGTTLTVTNTGSHHFLAGDEVVISNAVPLRKAVTSASASGSAWTINATAHGFSPADTVVHQGFSASGYNGTYTVASVTNANTYTVTSAATPGASTGGTTRLATPGTYFDGTYTVATAPNATTITITSSKTGPAVDTAALLTSPDLATETVYGNCFGNYGTSNTYFEYSVFNEANSKIIPPVSQQSKVSTTGQSFSVEGNSTIQTNATFSNDWLFTNTPMSSGAWGAGGSSDLRIKQIHIGDMYNGPRFIEFRTPQPKLSTNRLAMPALRIQLTRDLP